MEHENARDKYKLMQKNVTQNEEQEVTEHK
jgi:hypothetical protein